TDHATEISETLCPRKNLPKNSPPKTEVSAPIPLVRDSNSPDDSQIEEEKIAVAVSCLDDCDNDEEKRNYLRFLISPPAQEDEEVLTKIKEAWVFHISYENGFSLKQEESNPYLAVGTRMLFQLLREKMRLHEIIETYKPPDPLDVVSVIAKHYNRDLKSVTVILVVDGMQQLMENKDDGLKALEVLNDCLAGRSIEECNVDTLMNDLRYNLTKKYRDAIFGSVEEARPIARAILTRRLLNRYKPIPKTDKTPDEFVGGGLIRFEQVENSPKGYLTAPYIWLWIFVEMSQQLGDPILRDWEFADYGEQRALLNPVTSLQAKSWQSFEKLVASFRCIKSAVIEEDEPTSISEVHAGARLNGDIQFKNHNLQLEVAKHHTDTRSKTLTAREWNVVCYNSTVDVRKFKHCIINAPASPYGDFFLSLDQPDTESPNEIHQYKLRKKVVSKKEYQEEREKSASENDFFILFTTANCNIEIPKKSGIVDRNAFTDYFGPFAGRAYRSAMANSSIYNNKVKNIHTVSLGQTCNMNQSKER
ncbi:10260_t:CDS:2, partial [Racocetra fulgida]